ncbi:MAG TPA: VanZ family protein [Gemmatimonadales bacterium]|nr:VanZ family protein [Gemmatimonadales bacterium]
MTCGAVAAILLATLHGGGRTTSPGWNWAITSGDAALAELLQNLILFIPFGAAVATLIPRRPLLAVALGTVLSFSVEFAQQWIPGRDPSVGDIICNTASTAIGVALVRFAPHWLTVAPARAGRHALGAALLAWLIWFGTAAALRPAFPPSPLRVVTRPDFPNWGRYNGEVIEARLQAGLLYAKAIFPRRPPGRPSPLAAVLDARGTKAVILSVNGRDLAMRYHMPAAALTLEQPDLIWHNALAHIAPADTFIATTGHESGRLCLGVDRDWRCDLGYTIGDGWKLIFYPEGWPVWLLRLINACWVAGWTVGVGYWAGRTSKGGGGKAAKYAVGIVLLGMILVPATTHLKGASLIEWIGALLGLELGLTLGSRRGRDDPPHGTVELQDV